ncbi:Gfo/Idh/MocA family oxidoreductase [Virgibacillus sp. LDC1]|jgi:predicted dehydrogenase|uniref:Gfo/Idh/MocA family protein n=1 Tax=Paenibacillus TaxID=44249 RepID=UPI000C27B8D6|nr:MULTISPECIES: Gfo/Idh/MocA family oxidoreductase [Paenibacillus]MCV4232639.1 Gfo/Idh/MocA family oxidoreductase [Virgibacillus sp. LDC1]MEC0201680.1 Gfo/Idh/MocA family oxidoreductase [Paenibacillus lautus]MEC0257080.1 Gfo/Idh/MocA family oxidoreductase [Paenibacillus lautus]PJN56629.1 putative oxidoreductase YcjS [Paenibacillus sp. GM2FR]
MKSINVGVIGTGSISAMHLQSYQKHANANLLAVCDLNEERAQRAAEKYGATKVYTDYNELLADPEIDAVSICTWNNTHAEISIAALNAGKHVLVEKPLCRTVEEALQVQEAVKSSGKLLQVGFVRRYDPNAQMLREFADKGEFGDIYFAKASSVRRLGNPGGWFSDIERSGGGPLIDIGVHVIDLCWYMMGRPKPVSVSANTYRKLGNRSNVRNLSFYKAADYDAEKNTVEDMANAMIRFENGASLLVDVSFTLHSKENLQSVKLYGDKGGFEIDPEVVIVTEKHDTIINIQPQTDNKGFDFDAAFQSEVNHFISSIENGTSPLSPVEDGVEIMKILCGIYESAEKGVEVLL